MKKKVFGKKLSRARKSREALFASLLRAMILNGKMKTTKAKAKAIQGELERLIRLGKEGGVNARRIALASLDNRRDAADFLFLKLAPIFKERKSGFTRLISIASRKGDNAPMVRIEWTESVVDSEKVIAKSKKSKTLVKKEK